MEHKQSKTARYIDLHPSKHPLAWLELSVKVDPGKKIQSTWRKDPRSDKRFEEKEGRNHKSNTSIARSDRPTRGKDSRVASHPHTPASESGFPGTVIRTEEFLTTLPAKKFTINEFFLFRPQLEKENLRNNLLKMRTKFLHKTGIKRKTFIKRITVVTRLLTTVIETTKKSFIGVRSWV